MSELKDVSLYGDVDIDHSTIESCKLINCSVKNSTIHNIDINKDYCIETITDNEIYIPAGIFSCEVIINEKLVTAKFHIYILMCGLSASTTSLVLSRTTTNYKEVLIERLLNKKNEPSDYEFNLKNGDLDIMFRNPSKIWRFNKMSLTEFLEKYWK